MSNSSSNGYGLNWANLGKRTTVEPKVRQVYDPSGVAITLGAKDEKASGGEGYVYAVPGKPGYLVKIYKRSTLDDSRKADEVRRRIDALLAKGERVRSEGVAWPLMPVFADGHRGKMIGYVMRACSGVSFQSLFYGAKHLRSRFPGWDRLNLAHVAKTFVERVAELGEAGVCVSDFNPANFLVDVHGNISFIDTDSFQINDASGRAIISHTHKPDVCAPELLNNAALLERPRTAEQARFSAALIAFQILMCGVHPYNYYDPANGGGCGTPDENLRAGRCPLGFGAGADCRLRDDIYRLWSYLTSKLKGAFIATFRDGHANPAARTPLYELAFAIGGFILAAQHDPSRRELEPVNVKSHEYRGVPRPSYPQRGFLQPRHETPSGRSSSRTYNASSFNPNFY